MTRRKSAAQKRESRQLRGELRKRERTPGSVLERGLFHTLLAGHLDEATCVEAAKRPFSVGPEHGWRRRLPGWVEGEVARYAECGDGEPGAFPVTVIHHP